MAIFWVLMPVETGGRQTGLVFECAAMSVESLTAQIVRDRIVGGYRLRVRTDERGDKVAMKREPVALTVHGMAQIQNYDFPVRELQVPQAVMTGAEP